MIKNLIVSAHPDDETLFFSSVIRKDPKNSYVICVTDGDNSGRGVERSKEFFKALKILGCNGTILGFEDDFSKPLIPGIIAAHIERRFTRYSLGNPTIYTHSLYDSHWHHVSVAIACRILGDYRVLHFDPFSGNKIKKSVLGVKEKIMFSVYKKELGAMFSACNDIEIEGYTDYKLSSI